MLVSILTADGTSSNFADASCNVLQLSLTPAVADRAYTCTQAQMFQSTRGAETTGMKHTLNNCVKCVRSPLLLLSMGLQAFLAHTTARN